MNENQRFSRGPRPGDFPLGSIESRAAARSLLQALEQDAQDRRGARLGKLSPLEQAFIQACGCEDPDVAEYLVLILRHVLVPRNEIFGVPLPTLEELREHRDARRRETAKAPST